MQRAERELGDRITSYNVCYTKLLREGLLKVLRDNPPPSAGLIDRYFDPEIPVDQALRFLPGDSATARVGQSLINVRNNFV